MLVIDAAKRLGMREIIAHRWMHLGEEDKDFGELISQSLSPIEDEESELNVSVLQHMELLKMDSNIVAEVSVG